MITGVLGLDALKGMATAEEYRTGIRVVKAATAVLEVTSDEYHALLMTKRVLERGLYLTEARCPVCEKPA